MYLIRRYCIFSWRDSNDNFCRVILACFVESDEEDDERAAYMMMLNFIIIITSITTLLTQTIQPNSSSRTQQRPQNQEKAWSILPELPDGACLCASRHFLSTLTKGNGISFVSRAWISITYRNTNTVASLQRLGYGLE